MEKFHGNGFTLAHLDPFQPTMQPSVREGVMDGVCGRPAMVYITWLKLRNFWTKGERL